jgi:hypothetical protein
MTAATVEFVPCTAAMIGFLGESSGDLARAVIGDSLPGPFWLGRHSVGALERVWRVVEMKHVESLARKQLRQTVIDGGSMRSPSTRFALYPRYKYSLHGGGQCWQTYTRGSHQGD